MPDSTGLLVITNKQKKINSLHAATTLPSYILQKRLSWQALCIFWRSRGLSHNDSTKKRKIHHGKTNE